MENLILNRPYTVQTGVPITHSYALLGSESGDGASLTDGSIASIHWSGDGWTKFYRGLSRTVTVALDGPKPVSGFAVVFLQDHSAGIYAPARCTLQVSDDGVRYHTHCSADTRVSRASRKASFCEFFASGVTVSASFVRLVFDVSVNAYACDFEVFSGGDSPVACASLPEVPVEVKRGFAPLDGSAMDSAVIIYAGYHDDTMKYGHEYVDNKEESFIPYIAYCGEDGKIKDTFFRTILFLSLQSRTPSGGDAAFNSAKPDEVTYKEDFEQFLDNLFQEEYNLGALERAAGKVKEALGMPDYKVGVGIQMLYAHKTDLPFGDINGDGVKEGSSTLQERTAIYQWYIAEACARFAAKNYHHLRLEGFYQGCESVPFPMSDDEELLFRAQNDAVRAAGCHSLWIPSYLGDGFEKTQELGFDRAYMQPNYSFHPFEKEMLNEFSETLQRYGLGVELEINYPAVDPKHKFYQRDNEKYRDYLFFGVDSYQFAAKAMYQGAGPGYLYLAAHSTEPDVRALYDMTFLFLKGKLTRKKPILTDGIPHRNGEGQLEGKLTIGTTGEGIGGTPHPVLVRKPENGLLLLAEDGSYTYTPYCISDTDDSFSFCADDGFSRSEEFVINVVRGQGKLRTLVDGKNAMIKTAEQVMDKATNQINELKKNRLVVAGAAAMAATAAVTMMVTVWRIIRKK